MGDVRRTTDNGASKIVQLRMSDVAPMDFGEINFTPMEEGARLLATIDDDSWVG